jgi:hypothetical protein
VLSLTQTLNIPQVVISVANQKIFIVDQIICKKMTAGRHVGTAL